IVDINLDSYEFLRHGAFDLAFNLCDDGFRNDSLLEAHVPAMLDILEIPYTGANFFSLATCVHKARTKKILAFHKIPTPRFQVFFNGSEKLNRTLKFPLFVKPLHEDASIGIRKDSVVNNHHELGERASAVIKEYEQPALVETFIQGREVYVGLLGYKKNLTVLPISELIFEQRLIKNRICTYQAKWNPQSSQYQGTPVECPAKITKSLEKKLIKIAQEAYTLLDCQDYGRIDFRIDQNNRPFVLEVNPNPDISADAGLARMAKAAGMNYDQLIARIIDLAVERNHLARFDRKARAEKICAHQC
ncbi:MAG: ATP-grasp domain-containing protein, partial [Candidatus Omnitrophica bacterium]|nr:ATP-grasp domain-containing protein [Candidatus Omnitrophota bacterium]